MGKRLSTEEFIEKAKKIHGDKYNYDKVIYTNNSTKVCIICPIHGKFWQTPSAHLYRKSGCPKCRESQGEKKIRVWLENNGFVENEDYIRQYRNEWLNKLVLDFYFPKLKLGIEYDGGQHFRPVKRFGREEQFNIQVKRDKEKNNLCEENGIKLIRIPYTKFKSIERILESNISLS